MTLFFDNDKFYNYVEKVRNAGILIPIIAGIMPVRSLHQAQKMVSMTKVEIPKPLKNDFEKFPNDGHKIGVEFAIKQCRDLIDNGVKGLHFYTLNKSDMISEILENLHFKKEK